MCGECDWPLDTRIILSEQDGIAFLDTFKNPPALNENFKEAWREYKLAQREGED